MTGYLWAALGLLAGLIMTALGDMASEEIRDRLDHLPHAILRLAARQLTPGQRATIYEEEWLPELAYILKGAETRPVTRLITGIWYALGILASAHRIASHLRRGPVQAPASILSTAARERLRLREMKQGLQPATFVLALAGLGVSAYLTTAHFTESALAACAESGLANCISVTNSPQSYAFGIPVAVLGLAFYLFAVAIMSPRAWRTTIRKIHLLRMTSLAAGIVFVLYLLYAQLVIIGAICLYCTSMDIITFALFALTMVTHWRLKQGTTPDAEAPTAS
jgi:uncharacterized membrane protein